MSVKIIETIIVTRWRLVRIWSVGLVANAIPDTSGTELPVSRISPRKLFSTLLCQHRAGLNIQPRKIVTNWDKRYLFAMGRYLLWQNNKSLLTFHSNLNFCRKKRLEESFLIEGLQELK